MRLRRELAGGWSPPDLSSLVAAVAGASYGVGRGVCEVLGHCGATVYVTGRSTRSNRGSPARWTVEDTAEVVDQAGGRGVPVAVDHTSEIEVRDLFELIEREHDGLGLLVNNVWQWGPRQTYWAPTWEQPIERWDAMFGVGVRSQLLTTSLAIPLMTGRRGLIIATQERPGTDSRFGQNIVVDSAAIVTRRMIQYLARELAHTDVSAILVYLGWARTVNMGMGFDRERARLSEAEFLAITQSPQLVGRAIAELAADSAVQVKSGGTFYCGDLAIEYGFTDVDGRIPACDGGELQPDVKPSDQPGRRGRQER